MADDLTSTFAGIGEGGVADGKDAATEEKKQIIGELKSNLKDQIINNPEYGNTMHSMSDSLEVVASLGAGEGGNIVVDKSNTEERALKTTTSIVGYEVRNCGTEVIPYKTEVYALNEATGEYEGTPVEKSMAPGEVVALTRKYLIMLSSRPEFSNKLKNGKVISKLYMKGKDLNLEKIMESAHFRFDTGLGMYVNDDEVKKSVDEAAADGNGRVVKAEYVETFGYLMNPKKKKGAGKSANKPEINLQDAIAAYIHGAITGK